MPPVDVVPVVEPEVCVQPVHARPEIVLDALQVLVGFG